MAEIPRPLKRPGAGARVDKAQSSAVLQKRKQEEEGLLRNRSGAEHVKQHYNLVPQRGREWRNTESKIKGLRKYNNWVKSVIINRFSQPDNPVPEAPLRVLDLGCGKGGDLQKWRSTPHPVELYVGVDPAEVSIDQARDRYSEMRRDGRRGGGRGGRGGWGGYHERQQAPPLYHAEFFAKDAFGQPIADIPIVSQVGFDAAGAGNSSRWGGGGFDVVSMMFCMHYAFESEEKARGMLTNVAGSLKKGGKFLGVIPNSDVIRSKVENFHRSKATSRQGAIGLGKGNGSPAPQQGTAEKGDESSKSVPRQEAREGADESNEPVSRQGSAEEGSESSKPASRQGAIAEGDDSSEPVLPQGTMASAKEDSKTESRLGDFAEWGNEIYRVRFPGKTPEDGAFRPPFGWKYSYFMEEAVEEVPEYVVPWEAFRALAEDYNLELLYRKPFADVWREEKEHSVYGPLSERMGVRDRVTGQLLVSEQEMEAASFYQAFCFYKI